MNNALNPTVKESLTVQPESKLTTEQALRDVLEELIDAAGCIRHWHDSGRENEGMIVSSVAVRALWTATHKAQQKLKALPPTQAKRRWRLAEMGCRYPGWTEDLAWLKRTYPDDSIEHRDVPEPGPWEPGE